MMSRFIKIFILSILFANSSFSQRAQAFYAELGGTGLIFSVKYDTRFKSEKKGIGAQLGLGYFGSDDVNILTIPAQINWLLGKGPNYFEVGAGATYLSGDGDFLNDEFDQLIGTLTFGYRRQPLDGGFTWKISLTPLFAEGVFWPYFGGVGVGYSF